jgi:hypothetical protein
MTSEEMLKEIASLPAEARREIEDFVAFLRSRYARSTAKNRGPLEDEEFIGIWADREDMADSTKWVREIREKHWAN